MIWPKIRDLAIIGDRRSIAVLNALGDVLWYCPRRFDAPSIVGALLDPAAGAWRIHLAGAAPDGRRYVDDSAVLETRLQAPDGGLIITDWMPIGDGAPQGLLCRKFGVAPAATRVSLAPAPGYSRQGAGVRRERENEAIVIGGELYLYASHPAVIDDRGVHFVLNKGEDGWAVLSDSPLAALQRDDLDRWLAATLGHWRQLASRSSYKGPYQEAVDASLRALRLLTYEPTGGILAAATTSLPEVLGGKRNYDYRYVWLRDAAMIVRAFIHGEKEGSSERRFLEFIHRSKRASRRLPLAPATTVTYQTMPRQRSLPLAGYRDSRPARVGNCARLQLQMSAYGNVLLAAKLIYETYQVREHWHIVETIADFLAEHWRRPDYGIWEEPKRRQYTVSKVLAACGLEAVAGFTEDKRRALRYREAAREIRRFVSEKCLTGYGAYAAVAGGQGVDVSAALFPIWGYTAPDSAEMAATIGALERGYARGDLYRRRLESFDSRREGAFLAGTFWVAHYWALRGDLDRARDILDAGLKYANDLGLFAEEADTASGEMLGNFPQGFVHAAFINAVGELRNALVGHGRESTDRARSPASTPG